MEADSLFKYHKLQGSLREFLGSRTVTASAIGEKVLCFGTTDGFVVFSDLTGNSCSVSRGLGTEPVRDIAVDSTGEVIVACSAKGKVTLQKLQRSSADASGTPRVPPPAVDQFAQELTCVCVEEGAVDKKRERSYVVGTSTGGIIHKRPASAWSKAKTVVLFEGASTPVVSIAWALRGKVLAWADSRHVRLLSVANQTAICFINAPQGLPSCLDAPHAAPLCPCHLSWEGSSRLHIAWGDTFRQVDLHTTSTKNRGSGNDNEIVTRDMSHSFSGNSDSNSSVDYENALAVQHHQQQLQQQQQQQRGGRRDSYSSRLMSTASSSGLGKSMNNNSSPAASTGEITARVTAEWTVGRGIICKSASLDADHVALLCFTPPPEEVLAEHFNVPSQSTPVTPVAALLAAASASASATASRSMDKNSEGSPSSTKSKLQNTQILPELHIMRRTDGAVISVDVIPLAATTGGNNIDSFAGPRDFLLLSTYQTFSKRLDYRNWSLSYNDDPGRRGISTGDFNGTGAGAGSSPGTMSPATRSISGYGSGTNLGFAFDSVNGIGRGGTRGMSPTLFIMSLNTDTASPDSTSTTLATRNAGSMSVNSSGNMKNNFAKLTAAGNGDIVVCRVRDTVDRVAAALLRNDLKTAVDIATADRGGLSLARDNSGNSSAANNSGAKALYNSLVATYINDLIDCSKLRDNPYLPSTKKNTADAGDAKASSSSGGGGGGEPLKAVVSGTEWAAMECARLINADEGMWEYWISVFTAHGALNAIAPVIPIHKVALTDATIERIIYGLLEVDTAVFLAIIKKWGCLVDRPGGKARFDRESLLERLEGFRAAEASKLNSGQQGAQGSGSRGNNNAGLGGSNRLLVVDSYVLEAMGTLYAYLNQYDRAVACLLDIVEVLDTEPDAAATTAANLAIRDYAAIFELIEKKALYQAASERVYNLVKLNPDLAGRLLLKRMDKFPVSSVLRQLRIPRGGQGRSDASSSASGGGDDGNKASRRVQLWYLHMLFQNAPELYNTQEFAEYHALQMSLYCEFAPPYNIPNNSNNGGNGDNSGSSSIVTSTGGGYSSDLLTFLKASSFVPSDLALRECLAVRPTPLYPEIIHLYSRMNNIQQALELLLTKVGSVPDVIDFVETHDKALWSDVIEYSVNNPVFLGNLLDHIGESSSINPAQLIARIGQTSTTTGATGGVVAIPRLRERLEKLVSAHSFQTFLNEKCSTLLYNDTLLLLRQLNQGQRRAVRVDVSNSRCALCGKLLAVMPSYDSCAIVASNEVVHMLQRARSKFNTNASGSVGVGVGANGDSPIDVLWRSGVAARYSVASGAAVYRNSNRGNSFHRLCYDKFVEESNADY